MLGFDLTDEQIELKALAHKFAEQEIIPRAREYDEKEIFPRDICAKAFASGLMNFVMLPMWICSGVFFSAQRFPAMFQPFVKALPLTAVIDALRASMLQGVGLSHLAPQLAVIICWMVICFFTALKLFKWK